MLACGLQTWSSWSEVKLSLSDVSNAIWWLKIHAALVILSNPVRAVSVLRVARMIVAIISHLLLNKTLVDTLVEQRSMSIQVALVHTCRMHRSINTFLVDIHVLIQRL